MSDRSRAAGRVGVALVCWATALGAQAAGVEDLYARCRAACVEVLVDGRHSGTGWLATDDLRVMTAGHLFEGRVGKVELLFPGNARVGAVLEALDRGHDLALLRAERGLEGWRPLRLARRGARVGEELYQYGAPLFRNGMLQRASVAAPTPVFEFQSAVVDYTECVALAGTLQGGTSGGPWVNRRGEVVGVQSSVMSLDGKPVGMSFMAPLEAVRELMRRRADASTPTLGLGVDELWQQSREYQESVGGRAEGLVASVVREGGAASRAGVQPQDLLMEVGGVRLVRIGDLPGAVRARRVGEGVELKYVRPGSPEVRRARAVLEKVEP